MNLSKEEQAALLNELHQAVASVYDTPVEFDPATMISPRTMAEVWKINLDGARRRLDQMCQRGPIEELDGARLVVVRKVRFSDGYVGKAYRIIPPDPSPTAEAPGDAGPAE